MTTSTFARIKANPNMQKFAEFIEQLIEAGVTLDQVVVTNLNKPVTKELIVVPKEEGLASKPEYWLTTTFLTAVTLKKAIIYATQGRLAYENTARVKDKLPADMRQRLEKLALKPETIQA